MLGGAIIGVLVGIVLGIGATVLYRRERERDLVRRNNTGAQVASEVNKADSFDSDRGSLTRHVTPLAYLDSHFTAPDG